MPTKEKTLIYMKSSTEEIEFTPKTSITKVVCSFPSTFFGDTGTIKPVLKTIYKDEDLTLAGILPKIYAGLTTNEVENRITPAMATAYLIAFSREQLKFTLNEDWISYKVTIGKAKEEITPLNIVSLSYGTTELSGTAITCPKDDVTYKWVAAMLLCPSRISTIIRDEYRAEQAKRGESMLKLIGCPNPRLDRFCTNHGTFTNDPNYRAAVAMIDMFLLKGQNDLEDYQILRFGSTVAHRKDCAILDSVDMISAVIGYNEVEELAEWVFVPKIADDFYRVFGEKEDEETDKPDSYLHYLSDFKLVSKSPYSAAANPSLHLFLHVIGCALNVTWSKNAQLVSEDNKQSIIANALFVAYQAQNKVDARLMFITKARKAEMKKYYDNLKKASKDIGGDKEELLVSDKPLVELKTPWEVFEWYQNKNTTMIPELVDMIKHRKDFLAITRPGTIGQLMKEWSA